jgi:hypothetical protein
LTFALYSAAAVSIMANAMARRQWPGVGCEELQRGGAPAPAAKR